jgi:hypothetical protein
MFLRIGLFLAMFLLPIGHRCVAGDNGAISRGFDAVKTDLGNFYLDRETLTGLGIGVAGAAVFANTGMDRYLRTRYQDDLRSGKTDKAANIFNISRTALVLVLAPAYIGTYGAGKLLHDSTMEQWAMNSIRATVAGGPALLFVAAATGPDRPGEGSSHWKPFQSTHGISGHAFLGGIPFITAAKMSENPYRKAILYGLSALPGLARINDDRHYFSQSALGWYLAYLSCAVVRNGSDRQEGRGHVRFAPVPKGIAITVQKAY